MQDYDFPAGRGLPSRPEGLAVGPSGTMNIFDGIRGWVLASPPRKRQSAGQFAQATSSTTIFSNVRDKSPDRSNPRWRPCWSRQLVSNALSQGCPSLAELILVRTARRESEEEAIAGFCLRFSRNDFCSFETVFLESKGFAQSHKSSPPPLLRSWSGTEVPSSPIYPLSAVWLVVIILKTSQAPQWRPDLFPGGRFGWSSLTTPGASVFGVRFPCVQGCRHYPGPQRGWPYVLFTLIHQPYSASRKGLFGSGDRRLYFFELLRRFTSRITAAHSRCHQFVDTLIERLQPFRYLPLTAPIDSGWSEFAGWGACTHWIKGESRRLFTGRTTHLGNIEDGRRIRF